jgi:hypothetical protein
MPTVSRIMGFRFFFYSNEGTAPPHIHVEKENATGKYWLKPIRLAYLYNFTKAEEKKIEKIVIKNQELFKQKWDEYFGQS